jgi:alanyl-tRNA synthetase
MRNTALETRVMTLEEARQTGAIAPFGERYGAEVRVVDVPDWDKEFCGGTHLSATGGVGSFVVLSESAISSGVRRIEATTGEHALAVLQRERIALKSLGETLCVPKDRVSERVDALLDELKASRKQIAQLRAKFSAIEAGEILDNAPETGGVKVVVHQFDDLAAQELREIFDAMKSRRPQGLFAALASASEGRVTLIAGATADLAARGVSASDVIKTAAPAVGGSGGGKKEMAQAGGKNPDGIPQALADAKKAVERALGAG